MIAVRPRAVQPARVAVDARDLVSQPQLRVLAVERGKDVVAQRLHRLVETALEFLPVRLEPALFVVEAKTPHEVNCLLRKAREHALSSRAAEAAFFFRQPLKNKIF